MKNGRVLIIAGSDSGGGAGLQGDIKTVTCLGGYAATAVTALTAQNTQGVFGIHEVPDAFIAAQMRLVLDDIDADAVKTGMLHSSGVIRVVAEVLADYPSIPLVVDPVMVAKGGAALLQEDAVVSLKALLSRATIVTPNIPEAELLSGMPIHSTEDMCTAGENILRHGPQAVLVKGGHLENGERIHNVLVMPSGAETFTVSRIGTPHTHGTGCALASAIATGLAQRITLREAIIRAQEYVSRAIAAAPGLGRGHGPLKHNFMIQSERD